MKAASKTTQHSSGAVVLWREWSDEAFRSAQAEGKPILLALTATWCHWCHVMDQTSYCQPQVVELANSRFIPVRVDVDRRPDLSVRYNQGGFPSLAFLNGSGELITGRLYTPPEEMVRLLQQVDARYASPSTEGLEAPPFRGKTAGWSPGRQPSPSVQETEAPPAGRVVRRLEELYDRDFGGFGREPKQPPWEGIRLLLSRYGSSGDRGLLRMAVATLDAVGAGLYDWKDGGFFRYSVSRDWKVPHVEKMLSSNANLAVAYLEAYQVTRKKLFKDLAAGALDYLLSTLYDPASGLFYGSQDADEGYYRLPWKDRDQAPKPAIDRAFYAGWNAAAASALVAGFAVLGRSAYREAARRVLDRLWSEWRHPELGMAHVAATPGSGPRFLADQVYALRAFLDFYQATGEGEQLRRAVTIEAAIGRDFGADGGGFYDAAWGLSEGEPRLPGEMPLLENSLLAEALAVLSCLTGQAQYLEIARTALQSFRGVAPGGSYLGPPASRRMEEDEERLFLPAGSAWGRAWDLVDHGPVHLVLVGDLSRSATKELLRAALRTYAPRRVVQPLDPEVEAERIAAMGFGPRGGPSLYVCMGGTCLAPMLKPGQVTRLRSSRPWSSRAQVPEAPVYQAWPSN